MTPLARPDLGGPEMVVFYGTDEVKEPYWCFFHLENRGPDDIGSDDFGGQQVSFNVGRILGVSPQPGSEWLAKVVTTDHLALSVSPVLLQRRRRATLGLVTDGRPAVVWDGTPVLKNTKVTTRRRRPWG